MLTEMEFVEPLERQSLRAGGRGGSAGLHTGAVVWEEGSGGW